MYAFFLGILSNFYIYILLALLKNGFDYSIFITHRVLVVKNNKQIKALAKKRSVREAKSSIPVVVDRVVVAKEVQDDLEQRDDSVSDDSESIASLKVDNNADESYLDQGYSDIYRSTMLQAVCKFI